MKDCSSTSVVPPSAFRTTVRKESTTTTPGPAFSTSFVISSKTASKSFSNTTWLKFIKRTELFNLAWSKNVYCCWYRSILMAGSPRIVKYSAGRSGVALANFGHLREGHDLGQVGSPGLGVT